MRHLLTEYCQGVEIMALYFQALTLGHLNDATAPQCGEKK
jgi:hypothetical protein